MSPSRTILAFLLFAVPAFAQEREMDSLRALLKDAKEDTNKVKVLFQLSEICEEKDILTYAMPAYELAVKLNYKKGIGDAANNVGYAYRNTGNVNGAIEFFEHALKVRKEINDKSGIAYTLNNIALVYNHQGNIAKALDYYQQSLLMQEELHDTLGIATAYNNLGLIQFNQGEYQKALEFYKNSEEQVKLIHAYGKEAYCLNNIGTVYQKMEMTDQALQAYLDAAALQDKTHDEDGKAYSYNHIGLLYEHTGDLDKALDYHLRSMKIFEQDSNNLGLSYALNNIADVYLRQEDFAKAAVTGERGLKLAKELGFPENLSSVSRIMSVVYAHQGKYREAYEMHMLFKQMSDSINSQEIKKSTLKSQMQFEFNLREQALKDEQDKKDALANEELQRQKVVRNSFIAGFVLVVLMGSLVLRAYRQKQKANRELEEKNLLIEQQKHLVEEKNKDITDSINYAKRIQEALLPAKELKYKLFPDAFVLFQPRDIVSGDFYWYAGKNGKKIIAAVDCTGHGVPGAFMSMIGNAFLNEIIHEKGITNPGEILSELRFLVIQALKQTGAEGEQKDGMDISLLAIAEDGRSAEWAGANNPLWLIRGTECIEYKADKRPIGFFRGKGLPFTNHHIELLQGDALYIFTDGYADQFGGEKGKKFKYRQLQELLLELRGQPMLKQEEILVSRFAEWKGNLEQVDDVLVIGIRI